MLVPPELRAFSCGPTGCDVSGGGTPSKVLNVLSVKEMSWNRYPLPLLMGYIRGKNIVERGTSEISICLSRTCHDDSLLLRIRSVGAGEFSHWSYNVLR
jgi:hypothetical protein